MISLFGWCPNLSYECGDRHWERQDVDLATELVLPP